MANWDVKKAENFLKENLSELTELFNTQINTPVGGFYNPKVVSVDEDEIEFRCHYDNYNGDADSWAWYYDTKTKEFYN